MIDPVLHQLYYPAGALTAMCRMPWQRLREFTEQDIANVIAEYARPRRFDRVRRALYAAARAGAVGSEP